MISLSMFRRKETDRPIVRPGMTPLDWILEMLALISLLGFFGFAIYHYPRLPDVIPTHFNAAGVPDGYDSKNTLWSLPAIGLFVYVLLSLVNLIPHKFNYVKKITPQNALRQYTLATRFIRILKIILVILFFFISKGTVDVATGLSGGLGLWFMPVFMSMIFIPLIIFLITSSKRDKDG